MKRFFICLIAFAILVSFSNPSSTLADEAEQFGEHISNLRGDLTAEKRARFDELWREIPIQRKQGNFPKVKNDFHELLRLIPESIPTWKYAAWSLAYFWQNQQASTEKEYEATREAVILLMNGVRANPDNPVLLYELGWYLGQRVGHPLNQGKMRNLFREDEKLHALLKAQIRLETALALDETPDNWLVASLFYQQAVAAYDDKGKSIGDKNPVAFCSSVPVMLSKYAESLADEGHFGTESVTAWQEAAKAWSKLANRSFPYERTELTIRLDDFDRLKTNAEESNSVEDSVKLQYAVVRAWRTMIQLDEWQQRCEVEQTPLVQKARQSLHRAVTQLRRDQQIGDRSVSDSTRNSFDSAFRCWAEVYDKHENLVDKGLIYEDAFEAVELFRSAALDGGELPADFPLLSLLHHWED